MFRCYYVEVKKEKIIIISLLISGILGVFYSAHWDVGGMASMWPNGEKEFSEPIDIVWRGEVISTMAGGSCMGLKGDFSNYQWAVACLPNMNSSELWKFEGVVTVTGKWLGITCAYKNTIFGECVPDVSIDIIKMGPIQ